MPSKIQAIPLGTSRSPNFDVLTKNLNNLAHLETRDAATYVFLTSGTYSGNLGGISGAHAICQRHADAAGLPGKYKAWIGGDFWDWDSTERLHTSPREGFPRTLPGCQ
jgi:hypothetical protein